MDLLITEDYKYVLTYLAKYVNVNINNIDILEKNNIEYIIDKKRNILGVIDEHFFNYMENNDYLNNNKRIYNATKYSKVVFENNDENNYFNDCIFTTFRDPTSNGLFYRLEYVYSKNKYCKELRNIINNNNNGFHWSEIAGEHDEIVEFIEEFKYWNLE